MTLATIMGKILAEAPISPQEGILHHTEGVDLIPANIELSGMEVSLAKAMSGIHEHRLKAIVSPKPFKAFRGLCLLWFLQYYGNSTCNSMEFQLATFGTFILQ